MKSKMYFPIALLLFVSACSNTTTTIKTGKDTANAGTTGPQAASNNFSDDKTKQVLDHHWQAFTKNELDEVMTDYNEESVLITPDATYKGLAEIRKNFEEAHKKFPADKSVFQIKKTVIDRDVAYILWQSKTPTFNLTYASDTFIIRDGKIIRQTYAGWATAL